MPIGRSKAPSNRYLFELLALRLDVCGQDGMDRPTVRALARSTLALDTRILLRQAGFTDAEIAQLMGIHPTGCPCWECVRALYRAAYARSEVRKQRDRDRRYRAEKSKGRS